MLVDLWCHLETRFQAKGCRRQAFNLILTLLVFLIIEYEARDAADTITFGALCIC